MLRVVCAVNFLTTTQSAMSLMLRSISGVAIVACTGACSHAAVQLEETYTTDVEIQLDAKSLIEMRRLGGIHSPKLSVSPDGRFVAFEVVSPSVESNSYVKDWYVLDITDGRAPKRIADGGDRMQNIRQRFTENGSLLASRAKWSPDSQWVVFAKESKGAIQLWRAHRDGGREQQLTENPADIFGSLSYQAKFEWSHDGSRIYYEVARDRQYMKQALYEEGSRGFIYDSRFWPSYSMSPYWVRCGIFRIGIAPTDAQACSPTIWALEFESGDERPASEAEIFEYREITGSEYDPSETGRRFESGRKRLADGSQIWFENLDPATYAGHTPPLTLTHETSEGLKQVCHFTECTGVNLINAWKVGNSVVFQRSEGRAIKNSLGITTFYAWYPEQNKINVIRSAFERFSDCDVANVSLVCLHEASSLPRRLVRLNLENGTIETLFDPNPQTESWAFTRTEFVESVDDQSRPAYGVLVYPIGYKPGTRYPLIIVQDFPNGFLRGGAGFEYPEHLFAKEGFLVLSIAGYLDLDNYARRRGSALQIHEFASSGRRKLAFSAMFDFLDILNDRNLVDRSRVAITGLSSGSSNARYGLINSDAFATAILSTGYSGPQEYYYVSSRERRASFRQKYTEGQLPVVERIPDSWRNEQLGWNTLQKRFPPVLWNVSDDELSHAVFDYALLEDQDHPVEMYVYPDERHVKWQPLHRYNIYRRNIQWMKFWLQGEIVEDPVDPDQYQRWSDLCYKYVKNLNESEDMADQTRARQQYCTYAHSE